MLVHALLHDSGTLPRLPLPQPQPVGLGVQAVYLGLAGVLSGLPLYAALLGTRLIGGLYSAATLPTAQAYIADVTTKEDRARGMGLLGAAFGLGFILGPADYSSRKETAYANT